VASATPDVGRQSYDGLSREFGGTPMGQKSPDAMALGGQKPVSDDNFLVSSWKSTTGAIAGMFAGSKEPDIYEEEPAKPKKVGPELYVGAARVFENQNKPVEAEEKYRQALKIAPKDFSALVGLARLQDRQGNTSESLATYQQAIKAHPTNALIYNDLGLSFARQRQFDQSLAALGKAVELAPDSTKYRNNLATVLVEAGHTDQALAQLSAVASPAVAHYNVGYLLLKKGEPDAAARHFQQALAIDPGMAPARDMLAQVTGLPAAEVATVPRDSGSAYETAGPYGMSGGSAGALPGGGSTSFASTPAMVTQSPHGYHIGDDASAARLPPE
jgi:Tfp pilus assembly protein PilF